MIDGFWAVSGVSERVRLLLRENYSDLIKKENDQTWKTWLTWELSFFDKCYELFFYDFHELFTFFHLKIG